VASTLKGSEADKGETPSDDKTSQAEPKPVRVTEVPPPDSWYKAYVYSAVAMALTTIALALIGFFGIRTANRSLEALRSQAGTMQSQLHAMERQIDVMEEQTVATHVAAEAAQKSADVLIASQRAQLAIFFDDPIPTKPFRIPAKIKNTGLTPAFSCVCETWMEVVPHPFKGFTAAATYFKLPAPMTIYPNAPREIITEIWLNRDIEPDELSEIYSLGKDICFRIHIEYRDAFQKCRWQDFGFFLVKGGMGFLPKYNDSGEC
jgi:hypothetical protein